MAQKKRGARGPRQGVDPKFIGRRIQERRELVKITQGKLAELTGVAQSNVSAYETGAAVPTLAVLRELAIALRTTVDHLIGVDAVREGKRQAVAALEETPEPSSAVMKSSRPPTAL